MKAVILAGGKGTRLQPYTQVVPKPLLPYKDKPILEHIIKYLESHGVTEVFITLGYLGHLIQGYFEKNTNFKAKIHFVEEDKALGTAGCLDGLRDQLDETFLIVGGDNLTKLNLTDLVTFHKEKNSMLTPALFQETHQIPWGVYGVDESGSVTEFVEKPTNTYNAGTMIFVAEPEVLDYVPTDPQEVVNLTDDIIPKLLAERKPVFGFTFSDDWCDIGTVEEYHALNGDN